MNQNNIIDLKNEIWSKGAFCKKQDSFNCNTSQDLGYSSMLDNMISKHKTAVAQMKNTQQRYLSYEIKKFNKQRSKRKYRISEPVPNHFKKKVGPIKLSISGSKKVVSSEFRQQ